MATLRCLFGIRQISKLFGNKALHQSCVGSQIGAFSTSASSNEKSIDNVTVVGSGLMGAGIAQVSVWFSKKLKSARYV